MKKLLSAQDITVEYHDKVILEGISLNVYPQQLWWVCGVNGSGKTTLLKVLAGLMMPTQGQVRYHALRHKVYIGHAIGLKQHLSVYENLVFFSRLYPSHTSVENALQQLHLHEMRDQLIDQLSAGQQRRVALARLLLHQAQLWIVDEPLTALDADHRSMVVTMIQQFIAKGGSVVMTTHDTDLMQQKQMDIQRLQL